MPEIFLRRCLRNKLRHFTWTIISQITRTVRRKYKFLLPVLLIVLFSASLIVSQVSIQPNNDKLPKEVGCTDLPTYNLSWDTEQPVIKKRITMQWVEAGVKSAFRRRNTLVNSLIRMKDYLKLSQNNAKHQENKRTSNARAKESSTPQPKLNVAFKFYPAILLSNKSSSKKTINSNMPNRNINTKIYKIDSSQSMKPATIQNEDSTQSISNSEKFKNFSLLTDLSYWDKYNHATEQSQWPTNYHYYYKEENDYSSIAKPSSGSNDLKSLSSKTSQKPSGDKYELIKRNSLSSDGSIDVQKSPSENTSSVFPFQLDYARFPYFPWRAEGDECSNYATRFLKRSTGKIIALASFPGSGNTWLRYISEAITGVFTGSLYQDDTLIKKGFWGETDYYMEGTTLLQKAHGFPALPQETKEWDGRMILGHPPRKVILLIRNPYEALIALRHFHAAGHTGFGHYSSFVGSDWNNFTEYRSESWFQLNKSWMELPETEVLVVHYEDLLNDLVTEIERLLDFLHIPADFGRIRCVIRHSEGRFRRPRYPKRLQGYHFRETANEKLKSAIFKLNYLLFNRGHPTLPTHFYEFFPIEKNL